MNEGDLLLRAILTTKGREDSAIAAFLDYFRERLPAVGETFRAMIHFRTRGGAFVAWWVPRRFFNGKPDGLWLRVTCHRMMGTRGTRSRSFHGDPNDPRFNTECHMLLALTFKS